MKALKIMMELSTGINFDAGSMLIGLELHGNRGPEYNFLVIQQVVYCFPLYLHADMKTREAWYLTPLFLRLCASSTCASLFLERLTCAGVKQGVKGLQWEGHTSNSKYVSSMHPSPSSWQLIRTHTARTATAHEGMCLCHYMLKFICRDLLLNKAQLC